MDAVRSLVQPITHNLPAPIRDLGVSIVGETCYKALLLDVDVENTECIKLAISKGLGIGIVGASAVVKVPQILKLLQSKSAEGVSFLSYLLETSAYLISLAYNVRNGFPFSTFGETAFIMGQNVVIAMLVLNYSGRPATAALFVAALAVSAAALFADNIVDMQALSYLQAGAGVLGVASKVPQILAIWQEGGTGQLSAFAVRPHLMSHAKRNVANRNKNLGLQLLGRLADSHLYYAPGGRRQAYTVRLHLWLCPQRHPRSADGVLLERPVGQGQGQAEGGDFYRSSVRGKFIGCSKEGPYYSPPWLDGSLWRFFFLLGLYLDAGVQVGIREYANGNEVEVPNLPVACSSFGILGPTMYLIRDIAIYQHYYSTFKIELRLRDAGCE